jgi:hypothetical protein
MLRPGPHDRAFASLGLRSVAIRWQTRQQAMDRDGREDTGQPTLLTPLLVNPVVALLRASYSGRDREEPW